MSPQASRAFNGGRQLTSPAPSERRSGPRSLGSPGTALLPDFISLCSWRSVVSCLFRFHQQDFLWRRWLM